MHCWAGAGPAVPLLETTIRTYNLCLLGFGNVNRALLDLLRKKEKELRERGIAWRVTGVASRRMGWVADADGLDVGELIESRRRRATAADKSVHPTRVVAGSGGGCSV